MPEVFTLKRKDAAGDGTSTIEWIHFDRHAEEIALWLREQSELPERVVASLLEQSTFSRHEFLDGGLLLRFHTQKVAAAAPQSHSTTVRMWIANDRVISVCSDQVPAVKTLKSAAARPQQSWTSIGILVYLINSHLGDLESTMMEVSGETDQLEDQILDADDDISSNELDFVRRKTIRIRRQLVSLRNLLVFIVADQSLEISSDEKQSLESVTDRVRTHLEILEDCHERTHLLQDQIEAQMNKRLNQITYNLSIVATVFLPLSFITGLLGMNIAGIPETHNPRGFIIVCAAMVCIAIASWILLRWRKWI